MRAVVWLGALAGCDGVFGLSSTAAEPCETRSFDGAPASDVIDADVASISWDRDRVVFTRSGLVWEQTLPTGTPAQLDMGGYSLMQMALAPEADALFYLVAVEPPVLRASVKRPTGWIANLLVPPGTWAGTPSADEFGPRHLVVRLHDVGPDVQEYIARDGTWVTTDDTHPLGGIEAPNLTPSGLDLVFSGTDTDGMPAVMVAHRSSVDAWFNPPTPILRGVHKGPQLLGSCRELYVTDPNDGPDGQPPSWKVERHAL